ncbi:MAG: endonuclease/exonuclease/phosphatase family protein [Clostridia bacterium]|nr:endonuclease/exonuclease/phosphatase family protein [Clostridia bacterium]
MRRRFRIACPFILILALFLFVPPPCAADGEPEPDDALELAEGANLRIMSYNIMHPDWSHVKVTGRDEKVAAILRDYMPDVAAIQEAGAKWHKALAPLLMDTGVYAVACRQSNAEGFIYNTTCFLYNPQNLRLVEEYILDLEARNATRVFSVAVFERLSDGVRFVAANTHPAPRDEPEKYARNMADLTAFAADLLNRYPDLAVIIAGDFNTPEQSEQYLNFMSETGVRDAKYEADVLVRNCSTYFGYQIAPDADDTDCCVDHIFVNDKMDVKLFNAVIGHDVQNASDHIPIYADIDLTERDGLRGGKTND